MRTINEVRDIFLTLHVPGEPLLMPNPWDIGSAKLLASLGFHALATTSSGFAATLGRLDGEVTRDEALAHAAAIADATDLPVIGDLENGFADGSRGWPRPSALAVAAGLAGCSIEDFTGRPDDPIYPPELAVERIAAAAQAAHGAELAGAHRPRREPHPRPPRPGRHDRPAAGVPGGRRRRAVRPGTDAS